MRACFFKLGDFFRDIFKAGEDIGTENAVFLGNHAGHISGDNTLNHRRARRQEPLFPADLDDVL